MISKNYQNSWPSAICNIFSRSLNQFLLTASQKCFWKQNIMTTCCRQFCLQLSLQKKNLIFQLLIFQKSSLPWKSVWPWFSFKRFLLIQCTACFDLLFSSCMMQAGISSTMYQSPFNVWISCYAFKTNCRCNYTEKKTWTSMLNASFL